MAESILFHNRPQAAGWYRTEILFDQPLELHQLVQRVEALKQNPAVINAGGAAARWGSFATQSAGKLIPLDSTLPVSEWSFPEDTKFYQGAAIARATPGPRGVPVAGSLIYYVQILQAQAPAPDGSKPVQTYVDKSTRQVVKETTEAGRVFVSSTAAPQPSAYSPAAYGGYNGGYGYGAPYYGNGYNGGAMPAGLPLLPALAPVITPIVFKVIDIAVVIAIAVTVGAYVFKEVKEVFFTYLGRFVKKGAPVFAVFGGLAVLAALVVGPAQRKRP